IKRLSNENKDRMNRIGDNIPQIKSILASIEVEKILDNALIAYKPQKDSSNVWTMDFLYADLNKSEITRFTVPLDSMDDNYVMWATSGAILDAKRANTSSFNEYEKFSDSYLEFPRNIN